MSPSSPCRPAAPAAAPLAEKGPLPLPLPDSPTLPPTNNHSLSTVESGDRRGENQSASSLSDVRDDAVEPSSMSQNVVDLSHESPNAVEPLISQNVFEPSASIRKQFDHSPSEQPPVDIDSPVQLPVDTDSSASAAVDPEPSAQSFLQDPRHLLSNPSPAAASSESRSFVTADSHSLAAPDSTAHTTNTANTAANTSVESFANTVESSANTESAAINAPPLSASDKIMSDSRVQSDFDSNASMASPPSNQAPRLPSFASSTGKPALAIRVVHQHPPRDASLYPPAPQSAPLPTPNAVSSPHSTDSPTTSHPRPLTASSQTRHAHFSTAPPTTVTSPLRQFGPAHRTNSIPRKPVSQSSAAASVHSFIPLSPASLPADPPRIITPDLEPLDRPRQPSRQSELSFRSFTPSERSAGSGPTPEPLAYHHRRTSEGSALDAASGLRAGPRDPSTLSAQTRLRPVTTHSSGRDSNSRHGTPGSRGRRSSPDGRTMSYVDLLNVPYPQPAPAPLHVDNNHLRTAVGTNASLLTTQQTLAMYRANVAKTNDLSVQYSFALFMLETAQELSHAAASGEEDPATEAPAKPQDLLREARQILSRLADKSYPFAQYYLADGYASGVFNKGKPDNSRAFPLFLSASKHGHAEAGYRAALCYEFGWGTRKDPTKAVQFYRQSASKNHPGAEVRLGLACLSGDLGLGVRYREGLKWLKRAAESADHQYNSAPYELGRLHEDGYGPDVFRDASYAAQLFTQSADLGHADANYRLGDAYEHGKLGCPQDPALSVHFYNGAAVKGHPLAMMALCAWFMVGAPPVLEKDENEAYEWAWRAAQLGLPRAEYAVGYFTEMGIGTRRDPLEANVWYVRAADQGDARAKHRIASIRSAAGGQKQAVASPTKQQTTPLQLSSQAPPPVPQRQQPGEKASQQQSSEDLQQQQQQQRSVSQDQLPNGPRSTSVNRLRKNDADRKQNNPSSVSRTASPLQTSLTSADVSQTTLSDKGGQPLGQAGQPLSSDAADLAAEAPKMKKRWGLF